MTTATEIINLQRSYYKRNAAMFSAAQEAIEREFLMPLYRRLVKIIERAELHDRVVAFFRTHA